MTAENRGYSFLQKFFGGERPKSKGVVHRSEKLVLKDPLYPVLADSERSFAAEVPTEDICAGDIFIMFGDAGAHLAIATGQLIGRQPIFYRVHGGPGRVAYIDDMEVATRCRLARNAAFEIPELQKTTPVEAPAQGIPFFTTPPTPEVARSFEYRISEDFAGIRHRRNRMLEISSLADVEFNPRNGEFADDYLFISNTGIPIVISDYHQKLASQLALLIGRGLLPNTRPVVSWIDKHPDDVTCKDHLRIRPNQPITLEKINALVDQIHCGQIASFLTLSQLVSSIEGYTQLSLLAPPRNSQVINPLDFQTPFARTIRNQPRVLSFDLDQVLFYCGLNYNKYAARFMGLEKESTKSYFEWLKQAGMNSAEYDAVCIYTSPGYIDPIFSLHALEYVVSLFETAKT